MTLPHARLSPSAQRRPSAGISGGVSSGIGTWDFSFRMGTGRGDSSVFRVFLKGRSKIIDDFHLERGGLLGVREFVPQLAGDGSLHELQALRVRVRKDPVQPMLMSLEAARTLIR